MVVTMTLSMKLKMIWKLRILSVVVLGTICFLSGAECKRSACWRYGHVCWGGHGKRSGQLARIPMSTSTETDDGPYLATSRKWILPNSYSPLNRYPTQFQQLPTAINLLGRQPSRLNVIQKEQGSNFKLKSSPLEPNMWKPSIFRQNDEMQSYQGDVGKSTMDDAMFAPDAILSSMRSPSENNYIRRMRPYPAVLKRSSDEGNTAGGTEEPLETSANGMDSDDSTSFATFFRDRKTLNTDNSGNGRYSPAGSGKESMDSGQKLKYDNMDDAPISYYSPIKNLLPDKKMYF